MSGVCLRNGAKKVHFIGIGGVSMSGLSEMLLSWGFTVGGSDAQESEATERLRKRGIPVAIGNRAENIAADAELVVYTAAIGPNNPEYAEAVRRGIGAVSRAELLGMIMGGYKYAVCVAGTHGKTSTTALVSEVCLSAGLDPTVSIGGYMAGCDENYRIGESDYFIMEACEYADSFLQFKPRVGIILNVDDDHMDYFKTSDNLVASFASFAKNISAHGTLIINEEIPGIEKITRNLKCAVSTYSIGDRKTDFGASHYAAREASFDDACRPTFDLYENDKFLARVSLKQVGEHQMSNAVAAAAACLALGISPDTIGAGLGLARGVKRRCELKGTFNGALVIDEYAHHPTEITANLRAQKKAAGSGGRVICVFQPHTYSRTKNLFEEFADSFGDADVVVFLPIYASRESDSGEVDSCSLAEAARRRAGSGALVLYADNFNEAASIVSKNARKGDRIITMGAGDVYAVGDMLLGS